MEPLLQQVELPKPGAYILAISGGVDSAVLLDGMMRLAVRQQKAYRFIVAHVDHGMRSDSADDARFVAGLAEAYGLPFELSTFPAGRLTSEEDGRTARYDFFTKLMRKHDAQAVITAHHADDIVETIILNLVRGTGWRGLACLRSEGGRLRPLSHCSKQQIIEYAVQNRLEWSEDPTNTQDIYMRNRIRRHVVPAAVSLDVGIKNTLLTLRNRQLVLRSHIEMLASELFGLIAGEHGLPRVTFLQLPEVAQAEMLRQLYAVAGLRQTRPQLTRAIEFVKSATNGKRFSLDRHHFLEVKAGNLVVCLGENCYH